MLSLGAFFPFLILQPILPVLLPGHMVSPAVEADPIRLTWTWTPLVFFSQKM